MFSDALFGREHELELLMQACAAAQSGQHSFCGVILCAESGTGKSRLLREVMRCLPDEAVALHAVCVRSDQQDAFLPILRAIDAWCGALPGKRADLFLWREHMHGRIAHALSVFGRHLPQLVQLLDLEEKVVPSSAARGSRLKYALLELLRVLAELGDRLILVLDDLHLADLETVDILRTLSQTNWEWPVTVLGSIESELRTGAGEIPREVAGIPCRLVVLPAWTMAVTEAFLADTLHLPSESVRDLADELCAKTGGNVRQLQELLHSLHADGTVCRDEEKGLWVWNLERVRQRALARNVQEHLLQRMDLMPVESQLCLFLGAHLGQYFDARIIARVLQSTVLATEDFLAEACSVGLAQIVCDPVETRRTLLLNADGGGCVYRFRHERLRQKALTLYPREGSRLLLTLGRILLSEVIVPGEMLFAVANLFAFFCVDDWTRPERLRLAELCLMAGHKAKASTAYAAAAAYLERGLSMLPEDAWERVPGLALVLHLEGALAHFLDNDLERGDALAQMVIVRSSNLTDSARAYELLIETAIVQQRYDLAVTRALEGLLALGITFPEEDQALDLLEQELRSRMPAADGVHDLLYLPHMDRPEHLAAMRILNVAIPAFYYSRNPCMPVAVLKMLALCLDYGNAPQSAVAYAAYAVLLCARYGDALLGNLYGNLAFAVNEKFPQMNLRARLVYLVHIFVRPWAEPLEATIQPLLDSVQSGISGGDLQFAFHNVVQYRSYRLFCGHDLASISKDFEPLRMLMAQHHSTQHLEISRIWDGLFAVLTGSSDLQDGLEWPDNGILEDWEKKKNIYALFFVHFTRMLRAFFERDYPAAARSGDLCAQVWTGASVSYYRAAFYFYYTLSLLRLHDRPRGDSLRIIRAMMSAMRTWRKMVPGNFAHLNALLEAEYSSAMGGRQGAGTLFNRALKACRISGRIQDLAICQEAFGRYLHAQGMSVPGDLLYVEAKRNFLQWGARGVAAGLDVEAQAPIALSGLALPKTTDSGWVTKTARILGGEVELSAIARRLMRMIMDNSGAVRGGLFSAQGGLWPAALWVDGERILLPQEGRDRLPQLSEAIIALVTRSAEALYVQVDDQHLAETTGLFAHGSQSAFCTALSLKQANSAVLYLEFRRHVTVLPAEQIAIVTHLATLLAMVLMHDRLLCKHEHLLEIRTRELDSSRNALRRVEGQLLHKEPLARLGGLVTGMVQEVTTPLGTALTALTALEETRQEVHRGYRAGRLRRDLFHRFAQQCDEGFRILRSSLLRAGELVRNFKQISLDQVDDELQVFIFRQYLEQILLSLEPEIRHSGRKVIVRCQDTVVLESYPGTWVQIFTSLIMDALQSAVLSGVTAEIVIDVQVREALLIRVRDNGCGTADIGSHELRDPDVASFSASRRGLGLQLVRTLVQERLGGSFSCQELSGGGVEFLLRIPSECVRTDPHRLGKVRNIDPETVHRH